MIESFDYAPDAGTELSECRFRTVLEGQEVKCLNKGEHQVHRYRAPKSGKTHRFELVDLEAT
jgi:hypothetical protein